VLLALALAPAAALAHHHRHHRGRHHHARIERFGDRHGWNDASSSDNAGTVKSFSNGLLTLTLNDGTTVSGAVTGDTELECMAPEEPQTEPGDGGDGSGDQGDDNGGSNDNQSQSSGDGGSGDGQGDTADQDDQAEDQNGNGDAAENCSMANLSAGRVVHEADLRVTRAGNVWEKVELAS
jgi:hypothetical protein